MAAKRKNVKKGSRTKTTLKPVPPAPSDGARDDSHPTDHSNAAEGPTETSSTVETMNGPKARASGDESPSEAAANAAESSVVDADPVAVDGIRIAPDELHFKISEENLLVWREMRESLTAAIAKLDPIEAEDALRVALSDVWAERAHDFRLAPSDITNGARSYPHRLAPLIDPQGDAAAQLSAFILWSGRLSNFFDLMYEFGLRFAANRLLHCSDIDSHRPVDVLAELGEEIDELIFQLCAMLAGEIFHGPLVVKVGARKIAPRFRFKALF